MQAGINCFRVGLTPPLLRLSGSPPCLPGICLLLASYPLMFPSRPLGCLGLGRVSLACINSSAVVARLSPWPWPGTIANTQKVTIG